MKYHFITNAILLSLATAAGGISSSSLGTRSLKGRSRSPKGTKSPKGMKGAKTCKSYPQATDGSVYIMTNEPDNEILVYSRSDQSGELDFVAAVGTDGTGGQLSGGPLPPPTDDPLGSQDSLIVAGKCLLAVNAGSDSVSTFKIVDSETIELVDTFSSGGTYPVSIAHRDGLVYVLNAGQDGSEGNPGTITGFHLRGYSCILDPIGKGGIPLPQTFNATGDSRPPAFPASPAQIGFTPEGNVTVTIKSTNGTDASFPNQGSINVWALDQKTGGIGQVTQTLVDGLIPFSFAFDGSGNLLLSEAFGGGTLGQANTGGVSLYENVDSPVPSFLSTANTTQTTTCWVRYNERNSCAFTTNNGGSSITSLTVKNGNLKVLDPAAATLSVPVDLNFSPDQKFLYALATGHDSSSQANSQPAIYVYEVKCNCELDFVQSITDGIATEAARLNNTAGVVNGVVGLAVY